MRCKACDCRLTEAESCRRGGGVNDFMDLCNGCLVGINELLDSLDDAALTCDEGEGDVVSATGNGPDADDVEDATGE